MSNNRQSFSLTMFIDKAVMKFLSFFVIAKKQTRSFRECPFQMDVANFTIASSLFLTSRLFSAFYQTCV